MSNEGAGGPEAAKGGLQARKSLSGQNLGLYFQCVCKRRLYPPHLSGVRVSDGGRLILDKNIACPRCGQVWSGEVTYYLGEYSWKL